MTPDTVAEIIRQCLWTTFWVALPLLAVSFLASAVVSIIQVLTSMQDNAFSTIPRLIAFFAALVLFLPWMLSRIVAYTVATIGSLDQYAR